MNELKCGLCMLLSSSSSAYQVAARQEGWELELLPGSFAAGLWLVPSSLEEFMEDGVLRVPQRAVLLADTPISGLHLEELRGREGSVPVGPS